MENNPTFQRMDSNLIRNKNASELKHEIMQRLLRRKSVSGDGCWDYIGYKTRYGYGQIGFMGKVQRVSRVSAFLFMGFDLDSDLKILHHCDNPSCFNPDHLFIGTQLDNIKDMDHKCRRKSVPSLGESQGSSKLKESQIIEIRKKRNEGCLLQDLADKFLVSKSNIFYICSRKIWKHI